MIISLSSNPIRIVSSSTRNSNLETPFSSDNILSTSDKFITVIIARFSGNANGKNERAVVVPFTDNTSSDTFMDTGCIQSPAMITPSPIEGSFLKVLI